MKLKLRKSFQGNLKAVSPVIATIIIVAIAITMSIAVAYWLLGLGSSMTRYEKVQFVSGYATGTEGDFQIHITLKNTGTAPATLDPETIFINGVPISSANATAWGDNKITLDQGEPSGPLTLTLTGAQYKSGMSVEVMLQTSSGNQYPKVVVLP